MQSIYFDHAATSFPKAPGVGERLRYYLDEVGVNVNRGYYRTAEEAAMTMLSLREKLGVLFHHTDLSHIVLTGGATLSLNIAIKGALYNGGHCIVDSLPHNAVMRPLRQLAHRGVSLDFLPCGINGIPEPSVLPSLLRPDTKLIVITHASNVSGAVVPLEEIAKIARAHRIPLLVDAAQSAGHIPIDFTALGLSALAVPAHKGLLGPSGVGALLLEKAFAASLDPLVSGGTGSASDSDEPPLFMPDRFEPGTPNLPGIYGFEQALSYILEQGIGKIRDHEIHLCMAFLEGLSGMPQAKVIGPSLPDERVGVVSVDFLRADNAQIASRLEREFGICTRVGLQCAPIAHKSLGTFPQGTVRFSFGMQNTQEEIEYTLAAIRAVCS